jgi:hypothetical protein
VLRTCRTTGQRRAQAGHWDIYARFRRDTAYSMPVRRRPVRSVNFVLAALGHLAEPAQECPELQVMPAGRSPEPGQEARRDVGAGDRGAHAVGELGGHPGEKLSGEVGRKPFGLLVGIRDARPGADPSE